MLLDDIFMTHQKTSAFCH